MKPYSLYNEGMKPCVKSEKHMKEQGVGWHRDCSDISYSINNYLRRKTKEPPKNCKTEVKLCNYYFYTLSFTYELLYDNDVVYFAHAVPYTYNKDYLPFIKSIEHKRKFLYLILVNKNVANLRVETLCKTLAKNLCHVLTITNDIRSYASPEECKRYAVFCIFL